MTNDEVGRRTQTMRHLAEEDRRAAIAAAPNVIGHIRFLQRFTKLELGRGHRDPKC